MPITYIGSQNSATTSNGTTSLDATMPSSTQTGDLLIATVGVMGQTLANGGNDPGLSTPTGWTLVTGSFDAPTASTSTGFRMNLYYRKLTGTEGSTVNFSSSTPAGVIAVTISVYRGADTVNGYAVTNNPGDGSATSYTTNAVTIGDGVRLMSSYGDRTGNTQTFTGGTSYVRSRVDSTNVVIETGDSNGAVGAGSYKKTLQFNNATGVGVFILYGVSAAADTTTNPVIAPTLTYQIAAPCYAVDARKSASGMGGTISFTAEYVSGPILTYEQVASGYFVFLADADNDATYNIVLAETNNSKSPVKQSIILAAIDPDGGGTTTTPGNTTTVTSLNETVVLLAGNWS